MRALCTGFRPCPRTVESSSDDPRYGAVVRGANAYVPPGARRQLSATDVQAATKQPEKEQAKPEGAATVPKVSVNAPDGSEKSVPRTGAAPAAGANSKVSLDTGRRERGETKIYCHNSNLQMLFLLSVTSSLTRNSA